MNSDQLNAAWSEVCDRIRSYESINASQMNAFFSRLQPQAMSEDFLMLTADNDFIKTWIELHYSRYIQQALRDIHGVEFVVAIEVDVNQAPPAESGAQAQDESTSSAAMTASSQNQVPAAVTVHPAEQNSTRPAEDSAASAPASPDPADTLNAQTSAAGDAEGSLQRRPDQPERGSLSSVSTLTFENFVIGASNRMAYSMAVAVAEEPGRRELNPLFIYGRSGLGKTHLMRAIQNYVHETMPNMLTVYVDSADFLAEYVEATLAHDKDKSSFKNFKNRYQEADILLIDDIQQLQGKDQTLDIVFQIFNHMISEGKQVVLAADRAPKNITMDERYQTRFNSGGTFDIQPPEVETKLGIIKSFVEEYRRKSDLADFDLSEDIERYIAENSSSNIRELKSAVTKVIYSMITLGRADIEVEEVTRLLENHFSGGAMKKLTILDIQKQVEAYYDVSHADLISQKRSRKIVYARQIAIYLSRQMLNQPYNTIAKSFGGRDHTTIMYSVTNVEEKMKENRELREEIENIQRLIREM